MSVLNTSIDIPENSFGPVYLTNSPGELYDEIESIAEFLMDEALDQTLPDQAGNDDHGLLKKSVTIDFSVPEKREKIVSIHLLSSINKFSPQDHRALPPGYTTIFTPPPDLT